MQPLSGKGETAIQNRCPPKGRRSCQTLLHKQVESWAGTEARSLITKPLHMFTPQSVCQCLWASATLQKQGRNILPNTLLSSALATAGWPSDSTGACPSLRDAASTLVCCGPVTMSSRSLLLDGSGAGWVAEDSRPQRRPALGAVPGTPARTVFSGCTVPPGVTFPSFNGFLSNTTSPEP